MAPERISGVIFVGKNKKTEITLLGKIMEEKLLVYHMLLNGFQAMNKIEPGACPNFYFWGESVSKLEADSGELISRMEMEKLIHFQGAVKSFSIFMPYYKNRKEAEQFMYHLWDSYSIARDCYAQYQGIMVVECSEEWSRFGYNLYLERFLHFIREHREICFLILMPTEKKAKQQEVLFSEFSKNELWIYQKCETMDIQECITLFCKEAKRSGYSVTAGAKQKLADLLKVRSEIQLDNKTLVLQLVRQIQLDKLIKLDEKKRIVEKDIRIVSELQDRTQRKEIGFHVGIE